LTPGIVNIEESLRSFLDEDIGYGDITTELLIGKATEASAKITCKERAVVAGVDEALLLLKLVGCKGTSKISDGQNVRADTTILSVQGPARALLGVERTLLNLLSHMSGVATATADLVTIAKKESHGRVRVACTRKTLPGLRYFQKRAVELGGGDTHRLRLDDAVLIKDNHLALTGSVKETVRKAKAKASFTKKVEVEVTSSDKAVEAAEAGADIMLLDNMTPQQVKESVASLKNKHLRDHVLIEASGGINRENLASYAKTGVDVISVGAITHSARAIDMSLELHAVQKQR
jgi:nicotinate-nucleotide pyrophosphorylase (carboxylating)